jgi:hypothetical protein
MLGNRFWAYAVRWRVIEENERFVIVEIDEEHEFRVD